MKVAVLFYGRIQKFRETYESFLQALNGVTVDIFYACDAENESDISEFKELYKPIAVCNDKIEYSVNFGAFPDIEPVTNIHNMTCHFINKMRVFQLLQRYINETKSAYDIILSTRLDIIYKNPLTLSKPDNNTIYIPEGKNFYGLNDNIAFGDLYVMSIYMNIYSNALILLQNKRSRPHPESLNYNNMKYNGIFVERFPLEYFISR